MADLDTKAATGKIALSARLADIRLSSLAPLTSVVDLKHDLVPHAISVFSRQSAMDMQDSRFLSNHNYFILLIALDGTGCYELDDRTYMITPGTALLTFPFQVHCYSDLSESLSWLYIRFECENEAALKPLLNSPRDLDEAIIAKAHALINALENCSSWRGPLNVSMVAVDLLRALEAAHVKLGLKRDSEDHDVLKKQVHTHVMDKISEPFQIDLIGEALVMSTSYLRAQFKRYYGISLGKYVLKVKITHACRLILSGDMQMKEVADACGFTNAFTFGRAFKRMMCLTPREYRDYFHVK